MKFYHEGSDTDYIEATPVPGRPRMKYGCWDYTTMFVNGVPTELHADKEYGTRGYFYHKRWYAIPLLSGSLNPFDHPHRVRLVSWVPVPSHFVKIKPNDWSMLVHYSENGKTPYCRFDERGAKARGLKRTPKRDYRIVTEDLNCIDCSRALRGLPFVENPKAS